ncbi:MAG: Txe/YoeB family addiction module toxin [Gallionellaceae bacterium]|nr:Txe/YoeB family addiction module toxin [Gallionellaceae bacterium]
MSRQRICFTPNAWEEYTVWLTEDRTMLKRINLLIEAIGRDPFAGIGKPVPLKHQLSGYWSRRINEEHRLVYRVEAETLIIVQCRYHY